VKAATDSGPDRTERIKARIAGTLKRRFFLRFHISLILVFTFCAGLVTTRVLLWLGMETMWLRYLAAMLVAYLAFLVGVRLWLAYVGAAELPDAIVPVGASVDRDRKGRKGDGGGGIDLPFDLGGGGGGAGPVNLPFRGGGGGNFAGGGASDSFVSGEGAGDLLPSVGSSGGSSGSGSGFSLDLGDGDGLAVLLLALLVLLAVVGSAFWIIWIGPEILVEAAFEAMLAGGLVKSLHGGGTGGWVGRVLWKTLLPFILVAGAAVAFAAIGQSAYPDARTFREVVRAAWLGEEATGEALAPRETDPDIARADEDLNRLGALDKLFKPDDRARAASALVRKGELLARSKRHEEMEDAYDRAAGLVHPGDPPEMQHVAADAIRLKAYALGEAGKSEEALASYSALQERIGNSGDAELQWRSAWGTLQQAVLMEAREEGSGEAVLAIMVRRFGNSPSREVRGQVSDAHYTRGLISLWRAKKDQGAKLAITLPETIARFESARDAAAPDSANLAQAWSGIAYGRFLSGDRTGAAQALAQIPMKERNWILSSVIAMYVDNRTLPIDPEFRVLGEQQLKAANG
jgi:tetratricopeptide (TPR) repeat protein